ncbi:plasminogen-like [Amphiura filiformis]|uniref:plasminogen-like n=1 Tax=Amphiura filiformis TaxID=82378 RepID=UPI003B21820E
MVGTTPITEYVAKQQVRWFGHLMRMAPSQPAARTYNSKTTGTRARGRPMKRWAEGVKEVLARHVITMRQRDCYITKTQMYQGTVAEACYEGTCHECMSWRNAEQEGKPIYSVDPEKDRNYCRLISNHTIPPHCYVYDTEINYIHFSPCHISPCDAHAGCMVENRAFEYRDAAMFTKTGYQCVPWNEALDQTINPSTHPLADLVESYCRSPDNSSTPWCYYRDENDIIQREDCPVPISQPHPWTE